MFKSFFPKWSNNLYFRDGDLALSYWVRFKIKVFLVNEHVSW